MILTPSPDRGLSLLMVEGGLSAIAVALAFCWPRLGATFFARIEQAFGRLARHKGLSVATVGASALLLRLAILPICPVPKPFVQDDFSFLLSGDTFASGRLTNPTPAMWEHFESFQITMKPTYNSMYFPAQGVVLAVGKVLTGRPWYGLLGVTALMCAAICWMLQGWMPPAWALLGGLIAVLRLGLFSYWIDTYSGGGSVAALGGALVLGATPRLMKAARFRDGLFLAVGVVLLATSRPYEGLLLCLPVAVVLGRPLLFGKATLDRKTFLRYAAAPLLLILAAAGWMGYYNYRAFGSPLTPPYAVNRATYAIAPYYVWQKPRPEPVYRHKAMRDFYSQDELENFTKFQTPWGFLILTLEKPLRALEFFAGIALLPPLIMLPRVIRDRRTRFLLVCVLVLTMGLLVELWLIPHYMAPLTAAFYAIGLQAMRHLRLWKPENRPAGLAMVRMAVALTVLLALLRLGAEPLHLRLSNWPSGDWAAAWYGPGELGAPRAGVEGRLAQLPGQQLAIVRYSSHHNCLDEWVYNGADIDGSKVIWAREMDGPSNLELIQHYKGRTAWLVEPDLDPAAVSPYPLPAPERASVR